MLETLHRLGTYIVAFGPQRYTSSHWDTFMKVDMLSEFLEWLSQGSTEIAFRIWRRHQVSFITGNIFPCMSMNIGVDMPSSLKKKWINTILRGKIAKIFLNLLNTILDHKFFFLHCLSSNS